MKARCPISTPTRLAQIAITLTLVAVSPPVAGSLTGLSVSQGSVETTATTTYTFTFTPATTIKNPGGVWCDGAYFFFDLDDDYTVSGASLGSISPSVSGMNITSTNDTTARIMMYSSSGAITAGQQYTVVINNVQNPALAQTPDNHSIQTGAGCGAVDSGTVAAAEITPGATNPPVVQSLIPDTSLFESQGSVQYIDNLNDHFLDGDGDTMTFSAESSDPTTLAVSLSGTNNRTLSLQALEYGNATVTVTATATDGAVDDMFVVTTTGEIPIAAVSQGSQIVSESTSYTFVFTPETGINSGTWSDGAYIQFDLDDDFTVSGATLGSITPNIAGMVINAQTDSTGQIQLYTTTGAIVGGQQYTVVFDNVQNPGTPQTPDAHQIRTRDGSNHTVDSGTIAAAAVSAAPTNPPTVQLVIPDKSSLLEAEGVVQHVADLNSHFIDIDGDEMTFEAVSSDPSTVAVTLSGTDDEVLSLQAFKYGTANVTVTATATDGFVQDTFVVTTIGALSVDSVSEGSLEASASTTYTFEITPETGLSNGNPCDGAYFLFDFDDDFTVSGATLDSITPPITGMAINGTSDALGQVQLYTNTGAIVGGQSYTVVLGNIGNPASPQTPLPHTVSTPAGCGTVDVGTIAANPIAEPTEPPAVTLEIPDRSLLEVSEGLVEHVTDLNSNFTDPESDTITFAAESSDPTTVAVSLSGTDNRTLSLQALQYGSADITVTATTTDGAVQDTFEVTTIGELTVETIYPTLGASGESGSYSFVVTLGAPVSISGGDGAYIFFDFPDDFVIDGFSAVTSIDPVIPGGFTSGIEAGTSTVYYMGTNSLPAGTYTVELEGITNPFFGGTYGDILVDTRDGGGTTFEKGQIAAPEIVEGMFFSDGFESGNTSSWSTTVP